MASPTILSSVRPKYAIFVLCLPASSQLQTVRRHIALGGGCFLAPSDKGGKRIIPTMRDDLEDFVRQAGFAFGKDQAEWKPVGVPNVQIKEDMEAFKKYTTTTGTFAGIKLHLFQEFPFYDPRVPPPPTGNLDFSRQRVELLTDEDWEGVKKDLPLSASARRRAMAQYLEAKLRSDDETLQLEAVHGFYELAIKRAHHADFDGAKLGMLVLRLASPNLEVARLCAACVWALGISATCRAQFVTLKAVPALLDCLKRTLKMQLSETLTEDARNEFQRYALGALALLLVDKPLRAQYTSLYPSGSSHSDSSVVKLGSSARYCARSGLSTSSSASAPSA